MLAMRLVGGVRLLPAARPATRRGDPIDTGVLRARIVSWGWDYLVVLAWLALVFVVVGIPQLVGWIDLSGIWSRPVATDLAITAVTVVPYLAYLIMTEAGPHRATWGKRRTALVVSSPKDTPTTGQVFTRNLVKVLPWQLGHLSAMRFATTDVTTGSTPVLFVGSIAILAAVVVPVLVGRTGLHDLVAGTRVAPAPTSPDGSS